MSVGKDRYDRLVGRVRAGEGRAFDDLIAAIQGRIYGLCLRMLYHPQDAEDAAQEILIKIVTRLDSYRGEGAFRAWTWRIAANHLLSCRRKQGRAALNFEQMADLVVAEGRAPYRELEAQPLQSLIVEEYRIACLQMVLLGLDRGHRLAYLLDGVFAVSGREGADILGIRPPAYRKRLQRAKARVQNFLRTHCALIEPGNPCICARQADHALASGRMSAGDLLFVRHPCYVRHDPTVRDHLRELDALQGISALFKTHPGFRTPAGVVGRLRGLLDSQRFALLSAIPGDGGRSATGN
jgi:RNA polymerase sigma factor (sigma-70 family)